MNIRDSMFIKVAKGEKWTILVVILLSIGLWPSLICISDKYFFIDIDFIKILLSVEGTLFSVITAAYIFYAEFLSKSFHRFFQIRNKFFKKIANDEEKNALKKGLSDQFLHYVFLQYLLAFALLLISISLIFSIIIILSIQQMNTGIPGMISFCLFLWGIMLIMIWLLLMGFGSLPRKESYKALIED